MKSIVVAPDPSLLESMRSIGYTVESAIADVIDNSVAAGAGRVSIRVSAAGGFQISIVDDGRGMDRSDAVAAMRLAARSPTEQRNPDDLGRFGLGLKTASLSQCRVLTLVTKKAGELTALRWSLDHVMATGEWALLELEPAEVEGLLGWESLAGLEHGTLVHWGNLDQLEKTEGQDQADLDRVAQRARDHVALVFHLFNAGDGVRRIRFDINGGAIEPIDPFLSHSRQTQRTSWESIVVDGREVRLMAFTLPYLSRLSRADRACALKLGGLRETQGFYVYRGGRLVIWGTWFRVMPRSEMAKLTRVRVDIPNSLDHLWALDVRKSTAEPPPQVRRRLSELAKTMMLPSQRVQEFRGRKVTQPEHVDYMWDLHANGDEFRYEVNPQHPVIASFTAELDDDLRQRFAILLEDLQSTFPVVDAHNRMSGDGVPDLVSTDEALIERASTGWSLARVHGVDREAFASALSGSEPYCRVPDIHKLLLEALPE